MSQDIGSVTAVGSANLDLAENSYTIEGSGADIWGTSDAFHFSHEVLSGDGVITARVNSLDASDVWAKVGVMMRESLNANSANVGMFITGGSGVNSQSRETTGSITTNERGNLTATASYWVRISRVGDTFTASESPDGNLWTEVKIWTVAMSTNLYVGLAVTSHENSVLATAEIDYLSVISSDLDITYNATTFDNESAPDAG